MRGFLFEMLACGCILSPATSCGGVRRTSISTIVIYYINVNMVVYFVSFVSFSDLGKKKRIAGYFP